MTQRDVPPLVHQASNELDHVSRPLLLLLVNKRKAVYGLGCGVVVVVVFFFFCSMLGEREK